MWMLYQMGNKFMLQVLCNILKKLEFTLETLLVVYLQYQLSRILIKEIENQTKKLALALKVKGFMNIQFAIKKDEIYVIEVNPRASRTVPFVSKAKGLPLAKIASRVMAGEKLSKFNLKDKSKGMYAVKEAVFPFNKFPNSDLLLGPEMKSTGEVMGFDKDFGMAFAKSQIGAANSLTKTGTCICIIKRFS